MSRYCVIGRHGLLGAAIAQRLGNVTSFPTDETKVLFHFGSYTHVDFERSPEYLMKRTLDEFTTLLQLCQERGILFVYPSSALVYEKDTQFSRFKKLLEGLAGCYKTRSLGLRIFPVYGPGESRTVISQWCRAMSRAERPIVYGDGSQTRDFIYVDDAVDQILEYVDRSKWTVTPQILDVGTGISTSFNSIVETINWLLRAAPWIEPQYVNRPSSYSEGIFCKNPLPTKISIEEGIRRILVSVLTGELQSA